VVHPPFDVVLASASPRRKELLSQIIPEFEVFVPDVDEETLTRPDPWQTARDLAWAKASVGFQYRSDALAIGADTVVAIKLENEEEWTQLAKPFDAEDATRMLATLSGRKHAVITAVSALWPGGELEFSETSWVTFRDLSRDEIESYVRTGEPLDKAGAYAIQGGASGFVTKLEGLMSNVIGLPIEVLENELIGKGFSS
jgi:septum formation protein